MEAINDFSTNVDERFARVDQRFAQVDLRFAQVDHRLASMVTKDYLDDKLANLRADLVILARKGNQKLTELIDGLVKKDRLRAMLRGAYSQWNRFRIKRYQRLHPAPFIDNLSALIDNAGGYRIAAIMPPCQGGDGGSTPPTRSKNKTS